MSKGPTDQPFPWWLCGQLHTLLKPLDFWTVYNITVVLFLYLVDFRTIVVNIFCSVGSTMHWFKSIVQVYIPLFQLEVNNYTTVPLKSCKSQLEPVFHYRHLLKRPAGFFIKYACKITSFETFALRKMMKMSCILCVCNCKV